MQWTQIRLPLLDAAASKEGKKRHSELAKKVADLSTNRQTIDAIRERLRQMSPEDPFD